MTPARRAAYEVLRRAFEHDAWADRAFRSAAERLGLAGRDRGFAQRLAYGAVQRRGTADHFAALLADRPVAKLDPPIRAALRLGLFEILFMDGENDHAAVGEAVELAKGGPGGGRRRGAAAGLVNAVLRRAARERGTLLDGLGDATPSGAAVAHSMPLWIAERWWEEVGPAGARALMVAANEPAEHALRVNTLLSGAEAVAREIAGAGEPLKPARADDPLLAPPESVLAPGAWGPELRARIEAGRLVAQSRASQAVVAVLDPRPGERVLDLCAGPGIKTTQIAARMTNRGEVVAVEADPGRGSEIEALAERLGAGCVRVVIADAAADDLGEGYDRVLVDPPCTDLGALAARPDARWRKTAAQVEALGELQGAILARAAAALRPGGALVYSTCTISRRENEDVVRRVLAARGELAADDLGADHPGLASAHDGRFLQTRPDRDDTAGFFIARLRRGGG